jgi:anti-anti-sigma factor
MLPEDVVQNQPVRVPHTIAQTQSGRAANMAVDIRPACDGLHVVLRGELDLATLDMAREHVMVLVHAATGDVVLDLGETQFVSVAGVRLLADAALACRQEGRELRLRGVSQQLLRILTVCGLDLEMY